MARFFFSLNRISCTCIPASCVLKIDIIPDSKWYGLQSCEDRPSRVFTTSPFGIVDNTGNRLRHLEKSTRTAVSYKYGPSYSTRWLRILTLKYTIYCDDLSFFGDVCWFLKMHWPWTVCANSLFWVQYCQMISQGLWLQEVIWQVSWDLFITEQVLYKPIQSIIQWWIERVPVLLWRCTCSPCFENVPVCLE